MGLFPLIGGDARIAYKIAAIIPNGKTFVEAFGGAGSLTLHLAEKATFREMVWNDLDPLYYNSFKLIKYYPESIELIQRILVKLSKCLSPDERKATKQILKEVRSKLLEGSIEWPWDAVWTIVLHNACHIPWRSGLMLKWTYCPRRYLYLRGKLLKHHRLLQKVSLRKVSLRNEDALDLLLEMDGENVVFYVDPPHLTCSCWKTGYYRLEFSPEKAGELDEVLRRLKGRVLVKLSPSDLEHYKLTESWRCVRLDYPKDSKVDRARSIGEYRFYTNYSPPVCSSMALG